MNTIESADRQIEVLRVPVSSQGQVTLPKTIRERLGIKAGRSNRVNIIVDTNGTISIEPEPTVDDLFGVLKPANSLNPANIYELREEMMNERTGKLGYDVKQD